MIPQVGFIIEETIILSYFARYTADREFFYQAFTEGGNEDESRQGL